MEWWNLLRVRVAVVAVQDSRIRIPCAGGLYASKLLEFLWWWCWSTAGHNNDREPRKWKITARKRAREGRGRRCDENIYSTVFGRIKLKSIALFVRLPMITVCIASISNLFISGRVFGPKEFTIQIQPSDFGGSRAISQETRARIHDDFQPNCMRAKHFWMELNSLSVAANI